MLRIKKKVDSLSDEDLVKLIVDDRKHEHFGLLYDRYVSKVFHKCISFVKEEAIAEDLTHDIFLKTFMNLSKFSFESKFSTWLYRLTYNFCIDHIRKNNKVYHQGDEVLRDIPDDEDERNEKELMRMEAQKLQHVLDALHPDEKGVLLMKYQDEMSIKEISEVVEASESAVKMRIKRSKAKAIELYNKKFKNER